MTCVGKIVFGYLIRFLIKGELIMSILQEYGQIRKSIGEERFSHIKKFLDDHPHYFLSDVYYRESVWNEFEDWEKENF